MPNTPNKVKAEKILEISATHKVLQTLKELQKSDKEKLAKYVTVLYQSARLLEGLEIEDVNGFVGAVTDII